MKQIIFTAILILAFCFAAFAQMKENACPQIEIGTYLSPLVPDKSVTFVAKINESIEKYNLDYEWIFSRGKILSGQGTSKIEFVATKEDFGSNVTVSVKVTGLPKDCVDTISDVIPVMSKLIGDPVDKFGKRKSFDYLPRLDNFLISLTSDATSEGLIVLRFDNKDNQSYKISLLNKIHNHFKFRKFDLTRISFVVFQGDSEETTLWIVPQGADFPEEIEDKDYKLIKAEELKQKIKELFPKK